MPLDPQAAQILSMLEAAGRPPMHEQSPQAAREGYAALAAYSFVDDAPASVDDVDVAGPDGPVRARRYLPDGDGPHPVLVWFHGGGWVIGDLDTADGVARSLCVRSGAAVLSVDYRLAPEHPFPAAVLDCRSAVDHVVSGSDDRLDPTRVAVGGDSAGGNLAAVVARHAATDGLALRHQLLVYPVTDCTRSSASYEENADGYLLTAETMAWFCHHYLGETDPKHPDASPLHADWLAGVAPATVFTAEFDPLRDEGEAYAAALREAGVEVEVTRFDGQIHGFFSLEGLVDDARTAVDAAAARVREALS